MTVSEATRPVFPVINPATGTTIAEMPDNTAADAVLAVDTAVGALREWSSTPARMRSEVLRSAFQLMMDEASSLARLISEENGKPVKDAHAEVMYAADFFRWFAEETVRGEGSLSPAPNGAARSLITYRPVGIAVLVTPWNFPAAMITRKLGPALAAGCTALVKPAEETPLTALALLDILERAGLPAGVVTVLPTTDAAAVVTAWLDDERVSKLSFTGSTQVGRRLLAQCSTRVVNASMELGGAAPFVVAADADLDAAVEGAMIAKFRNGGQACTAANSFFVHESVVAEFTARFVERARRLVVAPATDPAADVGPMIDTAAVDRLGHTLRELLAQGGQLEWQAQTPSAAGHFFAPCIISGVPIGSKTISEEIFGPIAPIVAWNDSEQLLTCLNESDYGLASYVYSRDLTWALEFCDALDCGMVGLNRGFVSDPAAIFGGLKQSGLGREGGHHGMREFQEPQYISVDWPQPTRSSQ